MRERRLLAKKSLEFSRDERKGFEEHSFFGKTTLGRKEQRDERRFLDFENCHAWSPCIFRPKFFYQSELFVPRNPFLSLSLLREENTAELKRTLRRCMRWMTGEQTLVLLSLQATILTSSSKQSKSERTVLTPIIVNVKETCHTYSRGFRPPCSLTQSLGLLWYWIED